MGWNSWDCYGAAVTEAQVKANADYMAKQLGPLRLAVHCSSIFSGPSRTRRKRVYRPRPNWTWTLTAASFPPSIGFPLLRRWPRFQAAGDYIHSLGLKFGIHIMRGIRARP